MPCDALYDRDYSSKMVLSNQPEAALRNVARCSLSAGSPLLPPGMLALTDKFL